ncbi:hypothetical protein Bca4012_058364 [Brassica carinata]
MSFKKSFQGSKSTSFQKNAQATCHDYQGTAIGAPQLSLRLFYHDGDDENGHDEGAEPWLSMTENQSRRVLSTARRRRGHRGDSVHSHDLLVTTTA